LSFRTPQKTETVSTFDTQITDILFHLRGSEDSSGSVVIVDIDEKSLKDYGQWPWPRDLVSQLTENIIAINPISLGLDVRFTEKDRSSPNTFLNHYKSMVLRYNINLASRIEGLTKYYPVKVLITQATRSLLQFSSSCRYVDTVQVKGRSKPVDLYERLSLEKTPLLTSDEYAQYLEAIAYYRRGDFQQAALLFENLDTSYSDPLYKMYLDRCLELHNNPDTKKWCGIYPHY